MLEVDEIEISDERYMIDQKKLYYDWKPKPIEQLSSYALRVWEKLKRIGLISDI